MRLRATVLAVAWAVTASAQTSPHEKAAIEALTKTPAASAFPIEVYPVSAPMPAHPGMAGVFVTIMGGGLSPAINAKTGMFTSGALVYVRFLDAAGKVAASGSQEFPMHGLMSDAKSILARPVRFWKLFDLQPGKYRLEVSVYDEGGKQASVSKATFEAPSDALPVVGDLMIIKRADKLGPDQPADPTNPLISKDRMLMYPEYDAGVNRGLQADVNFIVPMVLAPGTTPPEAALGLLTSKGETLASVTLPLGKAEESGRLLAIGRVPLAKIPPGKYQLQITIGSGIDARIRTAPLTVVD
jgi:hypothetical protein